MFCGCLGLFFLRLIPVQVDILDLRQIPRLVAIVLVRWPINLFDVLTQRRFAPRSEGFIVFPTEAQLGFALVFDLVCFYLLACIIAAFRSPKTPRA